MTVTVDKLNAALARQGAGPLYTVTDASLSDPLDGAGSFGFTLPATDSRTSLLEANALNYVRLVVDGDSTDHSRLGLVTEQSTDSASAELSVSGLTLAHELALSTVGLLALVATGTTDTPMPAADILAAVLSGTGWTSTGTPSRAVYHKFGDETHLGALVKLAELTGDHFLISDTVVREIVWKPTTSSGFVPVSSGLRAIDTADPHAVATNDDVCLISGGLTVVRDGTSRITRLYPRGAGNADARLYINNSTLGTGNPGTGVDGSYVYGAYTIVINQARPDLSHIKHTVNDAAGSIAAVETFREIVAQDDSATAATSAANELVHQATISIRRRLIEQLAYRLTVTKVRGTLRPGMSIHLVCRHFTDDYGWIDVDEDVLVLETRTRYAEGDPEVDLTVTQIAVDRWPRNGLQQLVKTVTNLQATAANAQPLNPADVRGPSTVKESYGGTGNSIYAVGDLLVATATDQLTPLSAATTAGEVVTSTGPGSPPIMALPAASSISGIIDPAHGGTGVNNGTNALTVPATGTASLLGTAQTYTAVKTFSGHVVSAGSIPSIAAGTGAGTTPTVSLTGTSNDLAGTIQVVTGTAPAGGNATVVTVTFAVAYATAPKCVLLVPSNSAAAALSGTSLAYASGAAVTTTGFNVTSGSVALAASTTYIWRYVVIG